MSENFPASDRDRRKPVSDGFSSSRKFSGISKDLRIGRKHGDRDMFPILYNLCQFIFSVFDAAIKKENPHHHDDLVIETRSLITSHHDHIIP